MLVIFFGGVETTSNTAGALLMELAVRKPLRRLALLLNHPLFPATQLRPEVQQKVRDEINAVVPADGLVTEDDSRTCLISAWCCKSPW
jgi:hypothetical protein